MNRTWMKSDKTALLHNLEQVKRELPPGCRIMAVVKANAYGHGAEAVSAWLNAAGIDLFATATLEEAVVLRENGVRGEILILGYSDPECVPLLRRYDLTQTVTGPEHAAALEASCRKHGVTIKAHAAVDTGMHRLGFFPEDLSGLYRLYASERIQVTGIFSHMCVADTDAPQHVRFSRDQAEKFAGLVARLRERGIDPGLVHLLSSYAIFNYPEYAFDCVRLGILLFGVRSAEGDYLKKDLRLEPVLSLKARITSIREIGEGETVSYGRTFQARGPTMVASVSIGYADGIPRCLSGRIRAIVHGRYVPGIGRICMDQMMLDVTGVPDIRVGDTAVLIGRDGDSVIHAEELARDAGTITNEILSRLGERIERSFI